MIFMNLLIVLCTMLPPLFSLGSILLGLHFGDIIYEQKHGEKLGLGTLFLMYVICGATAFIVRSFYSCLVKRSETERAAHMLTSDMESSSPHDGTDFSKPNEQNATQQVEGTYEDEGQESSWLVV